MKYLINLSFLFFFTLPLQADPLHMAGGDIYTVYFALSGKLMQLIGGDLVPTLGPEENLVNTQQNISDLAIVPACLAKEFFYNDGNNFMDKNIRALIKLPPVGILIVVRADSPFHEFKDLEGKNIKIHAENETASYIFDGLSRAAQWSNTTYKVTVDKQDALYGLCQGTADALLVLDAYPSYYLERILESCKVRLIYPSGDVLDKALQQNPGWQALSIDGKQMYPNLESGQTIGLPMLLIINKVLPDHKVLDILTKIQTHFDLFTQQHRSLNGLSFFDTLKGISIPFHTGMRDFLLAQGKLDILNE